MTSMIISVDLRNTDNWLTGESTNEEISPTYQQKRREPKVGWTLNTSTTTEGIKSCNLLEPPKGLSTFRNALEIKSKHTTLNTFFSNLSLGSFRGESVYGISELFSGATKYRYSVSSCINRTTNEFVQEVVTSNSAVTFVSTQPTTTIQNRTFHMFDATYTFNPAIALSGAANTAGVFEVYRNSSTVYGATAYEIKGLAVDSSIHLGLTSFGNYLMFYTIDTLYWSDPNDFTEFTVGGSSLAGSQKISEAKGRIVSIVPYPQGLLIYCTENIINVQYSGDPSNPWIYTEIAGSLGVSEGFNTTTEGAANQFCIGAAGLQRVTASGAQTLNSNIQDLVGSGTYETKAVGTAVIVNHLVAMNPLFGNIDSYRAIYIELVSNYLIVGASKAYGVVGAGVPYDINAYDNSEDRTYLLSLTTGAMTILEGSIRGSSVVGSGRELLPETLIVNMNTKVDNDRVVTEDSYLAMLPLNTNYQLDNSYSPPLGIARRDSEVFIGELSISPDRYTEVMGVRLLGESVLLDATTQLPDETTRAKVYAYSSITGLENPVEFVYYPSVDRYLGFIVGDDIQIEVRGVYYFLTDLEIELQDGGRVGA